MEGASEGVQAQGFELSLALKHIAHWLPTQGPIKDFVHHNTLHAFQHLPFSIAVDAASQMYGAAGYLDFRCYLDAHQNGRISSSALERSIAARTRDTAQREELRNKLFRMDASAVPVPRGMARTGLHARWREKRVNLDSLVRPLLFKLLSNYLDQGIAVWRMPHAHAHVGLWSTVGRIVKESLFPLTPLSAENCRVVLEMKPEAAALFCLQRLVGSESLFERYLLEMLLSHPGWSGMVDRIEQNPGALLERRRITVLELVALELTLEYGWVSRIVGDCFAPVGVQGELPSPLPVHALRARSESQILLELWHEAFEWTLYEDVLSALESHLPLPPPAKTTVQAFFCLDDRAGSLRRHLDEIDPTIGTYGTAGFFGIDFLYQGLEDRYPSALCPVAAMPRHLVRESRLDASPLHVPKLAQRFAISSNTLFRGWLITQTLGLWHSFRLAFQVFSPSFHPTEEKSLSFVKANTRLHLLRESDELTEDGSLLGYSIGEMAERIAGVLKSTGLTRNFADLVVIIGHGSSSANNPHFAAYDCGACGGKPGAPNARAFTWMANHPDVRAALKEKGIDIPKSTRFLAALHDTTRDEIHYFDSEDLPATHKTAFQNFDTAMQEALCRNAKERCRRFELVAPSLSPQKALAKVRERSASIFEPRPELNHATNAICIVGRRELTRGLFLDRRAFLNSYDPEQDPDGEILAKILEAVIPVCGGINLEYYFSRVDNGIYGAGTKLPHNVVSLIGVSNGMEGDLRTGLPSQMTEVHDPVRLLLIIEQIPEVLLASITKNTNVFDWVRNEWVHLACCSPKNRKTYLFERGAFVPCEWGRKHVPVGGDSLAITSRFSDNIPVHEIGGTA